MQNKIKALAASILVTLTTPCRLNATNQFSDPGILQSSKTVNGTTYEKYSDGLTAQYNLKGYRKERSASGGGFEAIPGDGSDPEEWASSSSSIPHFGGPPNNSSVQSEQRQYTEICLSRGHAAKALKSASSYLTMQRSIHAPDLPLAIAEELMGRVYVQLGNKTEALTLLSSAEQRAGRLKDNELKKQIHLEMLEAAKPLTKLSKRAAKNVPALVTGSGDDTDVEDTDIPTALADAMAKQPGLPNIRLTFTPNQGCEIDNQPMTRVSPISGRLLAIEGRPARGMSQSEIVERLKGKPGTTVQITYLDREMTEQNSVLQRLPAKRFGNSAYTKRNLLDSVDGFDYDGHKYGDTRQLATSELSNYENQNFDIFLRAAAASRIVDAQAEPYKSDLYVANLAAQCFVALCTVGAFDQAKRLVPLLQNALVQQGTDSSYRSGLSAQLVHALSNLGATKECDALCQQLIRETSTAESQTVLQQQPNKLTLLESQKLYAEFLLHEHRPKAKDILNQIFAHRNQVGYRNRFQDLCQNQLPDLLEEAGELERARICFAELLNQYNSIIKVNSELVNPSRSIGPDEVRQSAYYSWRIADLQFKQGQTKAAIDTIDGAIALYDKNQKAKVQGLVNRIAFFFPTKEDLVLKRNALRENKPLPAESYGAEENYDEDFNLLRQCRRKIVSNDKTYIADLQKLLRRYKNRAQVPNYEQHPLNLFCALMGIARQLTDHQHIKDSDSLLEVLKTSAITIEQTPMATLLPELELAYNRELQHTPATAEAHWKIVESLLTPTDWSAIFPDLANNRSVKESLTLVGKLEANRYLANIYSKGYEQKRADSLIRRCYPIYDRLNRSALTQLDHALVARLKIMLLLDQAEIDARRGDIKQAMEVGSRAIALSAHTAPAKSAGLNAAFDNCYSTKIAEIAKIIGSSKQHTNDATKLLMLANATINDGATAKHDVTSQGYTVCAPLINSFLAKLLFDHGQYAKAVPAIKNAILQGRGSVPNATWYLAAEIAEHCGQFEDAAHYFSQAELNLDYFYNNHIPPNARIILLSKARFCSQKGQSPTSPESINIALRLGVLLAKSKPSEALSNYEFAYNLIDDTNPNKSDLLNAIARLKAVLKTSKAPQVSSLTTAGTKSNASSTKLVSSSPKQKSEQDMIAADVAQSMNELPTLRATAELSQKSTRSNYPWQAWMDVAIAEGQVGNLDEALRDAQLSIQKFERMEITYPAHIPILGAGWYRALPDALRRQGRADDAEKLLTEALDKVCEINGAQSAAAARQRACIVKYWAKANNDTQTIIELNELLKLPARLLEIGNPYAACLPEMYRFADELAKENRIDLARVILKRISAAQLNQLGPDDYRLSTTKLAISKFEEKQRNYGEALRELLDAIHIRERFIGLRAYSEQSANLKNLLHEAGRDADNKWIATQRMGELPPALLRQANYKVEAESLEKDGELPKTLNDAQFPFERRDSKGDIDWQSEADKAAKFAPYSSWAFNANERLMREYLGSWKWNELKKCAEVLISIYEHSSDPAAGRQTGCIIPNTTRVDYYLAAAKASMKLGKPDLAKKYVQRAVEILPEVSAWEYQSLAEFEIESGDKVYAKELLDKSLAVSPKVYHGNDAPNPVLYEKVGFPEIAWKIREKEKLKKSLYDKQQVESRSKNNVFNNVQFY